MKIYIPLWEDDPHNEMNPFVATYTDSIMEHHDDVEFFYGLNLLWKKECGAVDIVHIMWPHCFEYQVAAGNDLEGRLRQLKACGVTIIATCHNLKPHVENTPYTKFCYDTVYSLSDVIVHLGQYSLDYFGKKYPLAKHVIIPHHVYDTVYGAPQERNDSLRYLGLPDGHRYILCLGAFRTDDERKLVMAVGKSLKADGVRIIAPSILKFPRKRKNPRLWLQAIHQWLRCRYCGIITRQNAVTDLDIPFFYGAADIALVHRIEILNSGNVPLALYMGKVVVGPNIGNVGQLLQQTGNVVFNPQDQQSVVSAVNNALDLSLSARGKENREFTLRYFSTNSIAAKYWNLYRGCFSS